MSPQNIDVTSNDVFIIVANVSNKDIDELNKNTKLGGSINSENSAGLDTNSINNLRILLNDYIKRVRKKFRISPKKNNIPIGSIAGDTKLSKLITIVQEKLSIQESQETKNDIYIIIEESTGKSKEDFKDKSKLGDSSTSDESIGLSSSEIKDIIKLLNKYISTIRMNHNYIPFKNDISNQTVNGETILKDLVGTVQEKLNEFLQ